MIMSCIKAGTIPGELSRGNDSAVSFVCLPRQKAAADNTNEGLSFIAARNSTTDEITEIV